MSDIKSLMAVMAERFGVPQPEMLATLKATAFKGQVSDAQMTALLIVANQYGLNPWTKEIYAFPDKNNGIVPVVGVDGWSRIINEHPQFDGLEFEQDDESCTCIIHRKDRSHPIKVTEWRSECDRKQGPWASHPKRMLRHKALIQCARLAMGYVGIFDEDEAERIIEKDITPAKVVERITGSDLVMIVGALESVGMSEADFCKVSRIESVIDLPLAKFAGAMNWIKNQATNVNTATGDVIDHE